MLTNETGTPSTNETGTLSTSETGNQPTSETLAPFGGDNKTSNLASTFEGIAYNIILAL